MQQKNREELHKTMKDLTQEAKEFRLNNTNLNPANPFGLYKLMSDFAQQRIIKDRETFLSEKVDKEGNTLKEPSYDTEDCYTALGQDYVKKRQQEYQNALTRKQHIQQEAVNELLEVAQLGLDQLLQLDSALNEPNYMVKGFHLNDDLEPVSSFFEQNDLGAIDKLEQTINKYKNND